MQLDSYRNIDGQLADTPPELVNQVHRDTLLGRRLMRSLLDSDQQMPATGIRKGHAILGQFIPLRVSARQRAQRFVIFNLAFKTHHRTRSPDSRMAA